MLKRGLMLAISLSLLAACHSTTPTSTLDQKYPQAKYKISDKEMKQVVAHMNSLEQCFYPQLKTMSNEEAYTKVYNKYSEVEEFIWNEVVFETVISDIVGEENLKTILTDLPSEQYFAEKQKMLNNQTDTVNSVDCHIFRKSFNSVKAKIEAKLKNRLKGVTSYVCNNG